jgi:hypothetical protein
VRPFRDLILAMRAERDRQGLSVLRRSRFPRFLNSLKSRGIKTWFFPDDALPGQKLHRVMHDGLNRHERVLLICSERSLQRPGVLNELERVFEREAREGGSDILIPVTLDDFVFGDWAPARPDVAAQVRSRVVTKLDFEPNHENQLHAQLEKIVKVLSKS